jgi:hypothetical protein
MNSPYHMVVGNAALCITARLRERRGRALEALAFAARLVALAQRGVEGRRQACDVFRPKRMIVFEKSSNWHVPRLIATCRAGEMELIDSVSAR